MDDKKITPNQTGPLSLLAPLVPPVCSRRVGATTAGDLSPALQDTGEAPHVLQTPVGVGDGREPWLWWGKPTELSRDTGEALQAPRWCGERQPGYPQVECDILSGCGDCWAWEARRRRGAMQWEPHCKLDREREGGAGRQPSQSWIGRVC